MTPNETLQLMAKSRQPRVSANDQIHALGSDHDLRRALVEFLGAEVLPRIVELSTPLFCYDDQRNLVIVATSIVLEIGPSRHLLTATHAITQNSSRNLYVSLNGELRLLRGETFAIHAMGSAPGSSVDHLDVTAVRLHESLASMIPSASVAGLADLDLTSTESDSGSFVLVGYPSTKSADGLQGETFSAFAYSLLVSDGDASFYSAVGAELRSQIAVPADRKDIWAIEGKVTAPKPEGMSGCGLWRVPIGHHSSLSTATLAGVAVEWEQKRTPKRILATRMRPILAMIHDKHADIRDHIATVLSAPPSHDV